MKLSGRTRFRVTFTGRLVIQVEVEWDVYPGAPSSDRAVTRRKWRDATIADVQELTLLQIHINGE